MGMFNLGGIWTRKFGTSFTHQETCISVSREEIHITRWAGQMDKWKESTKLNAQRYLYSIVMSSIKS